MIDKLWSQSYNCQLEKQFYKYISLKLDMETALRKLLNKMKQLLQNLLLCSSRMTLATTTTRKLRPGQ